MLWIIMLLIIVLLTNRLFIIRILPNRLFNRILLVNNLMDMILLLLLSMLVEENRLFIYKLILLSYKLTLLSYKLTLLSMHNNGWFDSFLFTTSRLFFVCWFSGFLSSLFRFSIVRFGWYCYINLLLQLWLFFIINCLLFIYIFFFNLTWLLYLLSFLFVLIMLNIAN